MKKEIKRAIFLAVFLVFAAVAYPDDCFPECSDDYDEWVAVGEPNSWCIPRQCHGDADGLQEGLPHMPHYVGVADLWLLVYYWKIKEPPQGPGLIGTEALAADFDHRGAGSPYTGQYRVNPNDVNILAAYWYRQDVDPNCQCCGIPWQDMEGAKLALEVDFGAGYLDREQIELDPNETVWIGISNATSDLGYYDGYVIMTDGLEYGSWTGDTWIYDDLLPGWSYYGTVPLAGQDAWFVEASKADTTGGPDETASSGIEYRQDGCGDVTVKLYNEFYEEVDSLVINGPNVFVELPNGGEILYGGTVYPIRWQTRQEITSVKVEYSINNGGNWAEVEPSNTGNTGSYNWLVPVVESSQCLVKVSDVSDPCKFDTSNAAFTIELLSEVTLLAPNGGEEFVAGHNTTIGWESVGAVGEIAIEYSDSNGVGGSWEVVDPNTPNDGQYEWTVPQVTSNQCLVRISDVSDPCVYDMSDDVFTIYVCMVDLLGDLNNDCYVNLTDFALFVLNWLRCGNPFDPDCEAPEGMVLIPGGEFEMGRHVGDGESNELPIHTVYVDSFRMSKHEITNQQYCDYLNSAYPTEIKVDAGIVYASVDTSNSYPYCDTSISSFYSQIDYSGGVFNIRTKSGRDMSNDPMVHVSWYGAAGYCNWRSDVEGYESCYNLSTWECDPSKHSYRLPTEAEWEYAARGGNHNPYYRFSWGDTISHSQANYDADPCSWSYDVSPTVGYHPAWNDGIYPYTSVVDSFSANSYGLYDMSGNVWDWCSDWYDENYYDVSPFDNPEGPASGSYRVLRGGSWGDSAGNCRVSSRLSYTPEGVGSIVGFRVVLDLD